MYLWLLSAAGVVTAIAGALSRVMAIPVVNEWLTHIGLGSEPKAVAVERAAAKSPDLQPAQFERSTVDYRDDDSSNGQSRPCRSPRGWASCVASRIIRVHPDSHRRSWDWVSGTLSVSDIIQGPGLR